jgi:hypothetical protein
MTRFATPLILALAWVSAIPAAEPDDHSGAKAELLLPRFRADKNKFKDNPGLEDALKGVPSVKAEDSLFGISLKKGKGRVNGFYTRFTFDPSKADLGDVAKAIAAVPVAEDKQKEPAAILILFTTEREILTQEQLAKVWKALAEVKGIKVDESRELRADENLGVVIDEKGGAKLAEIVAAVKSAGFELRKR